MVANAQSVTRGLEQKGEKRPRAFEKIKNPILKGAKSFRTEPPLASLPQTHARRACYHSVLPSARTGCSSLTSLPSAGAGTERDSTAARQNRGTRSCLLFTRAHTATSCPRGWQIRAVTGNGSLEWKGVALESEDKAVRLGAYK